MRSLKNHCIIFFPGIRCGLPEKEVNSYVEISGDDYLSTANYTCFEGYQIENTCDGNSTNNTCEQNNTSLSITTVLRTCLITTQWDGPGVNCTSRFPNHDSKIMYGFS